MADSQGFGWKDELLLREAAAMDRNAARAVERAEARQGAAQASEEESVVMSRESWRQLVDSAARLASEKAELRRRMERGMTYERSEDGENRSVRRRGEVASLAATLVLVFVWGVMIGAVLMNVQSKWRQVAQETGVSVTAKGGGSGLSAVR